MKCFKMDKFSGKGEEWDDFSFAFRRTCRSLDTDVFRLMGDVELNGEDKVRVIEQDIDCQQTSGELCDILCRMVGGEALAIVKAAPDCEGYHAWHLLHKKYNPRTLARGVRLLAEAVNPVKAKTIFEVESAINNWEDKVRKLRVMYGENLQREMKIAMFANIMPAEVQDWIYTNLAKDAEYEDLRERVRALISNTTMAMQNGRVPMDVGAVRGGQGERGPEDGAEDDQGSWQDFDIDCVNTQCHKCH